MPMRAVPDELLIEARRAVEHAPSKAEAARQLGIPVNTLKSRLEMADARFGAERVGEEIVFPDLEPDDLPIDELIDLARERSRLRLQAEKAKQNQIIRIKHSEPSVIAFVGDPHLDDDGCDWDRLLADVALLRQPNVYAVNVGDTTNNWVGRLMRLYANQEASRKTARRYARWFLEGAGVRWIVWCMGNHDDWESGADILRLMNTRGIVMDDWSSRFTIEWGNGAQVPFWVAHDFPGSSQWNRMHALMKAAMMRGGAAVYAAGHRHVPGLHWEALEDKDASYWALRSKGYKAIDSHTKRLGYGQIEEGHTTAVVVDPRASDVRDAVTGFKSLRAAVAFRDALAS